VQAAAVRAAAGHRPFSVSWGGIVSLGATEADAHAKAAGLGAVDDHLIGDPRQVADQILTWGAAGADWVIVGAIDAANPEVVSTFGEVVAPMVRATVPTRNASTTSLG
jgi:alkanesulfonate monooxygenase SsuD/methylene tetrahydromethanopterin reductase-like flavin-dependent oxidoreductase (luciferase family)